MPLDRKVFHLELVKSHECAADRAFPAAVNELEHWFPVFT